MEGLSASTRRVISVGAFSGFKVGSGNLELSHLQFTYNFVIVGIPLLDNLLSIKTVLRSFELASELKNNFSKSRIFGVNVISEFMVMAEEF